MTNKEYVSRRDALLQEQAPYIVMSKNELIAEGENFYNIRGVPVMVTPNVQNRLDQLIGLSPRQREGVKQAYGNDVVMNLRNSFAMANCVARPKKFALIANAAESIVDGIVMKKRYPCALFSMSSKYLPTNTVMRLTNCRAPPVPHMA